MKLSFVWKYLILTCFIDLGAKSNRNYYAKITRVACNSSGITSVNVSCSVKPLSPYNSIFRLESDLLRPISNFFATSTGFHKPITSTRYYQMFNLKNLEVCKWMKVSKSSKGGWLKDMIAYLNLTFAGIIHACPYKGHFAMINATNNLDNPDIAKALKAMQVYPNGAYRFRIRIHDQRDDNIGTFIFWNDFYSRENHLNGYDTL